MSISSTEISSENWERLLAFRQDKNTSWASGSGLDLYGPIATARDSFVVAQVGQSLDGRVATPTGDARDVSGPDGLAHLHRCRALVDAVVVGATTVSVDNPRLSVRLVNGPHPVRVVIDCHGTLSGNEGLFHDGGAPVIVFRSVDAPQRSLNADVIRLRPGVKGLAPDDILRELRERGLNTILIEGGAKTIARFVDAGLVDRLHVAISTVIIGSGPSGIRLSPIDRLTSAYRPNAKIYSLGSDILFDCELKGCNSSACEEAAALQCKHN